MIITSFIQNIAGASAVAYFQKSKFSIKFTKKQINQKKKEEKMVHRQGELKKERKTRSLFDVINQQIYIYLQGRCSKSDINLS